MKQVTFEKVFYIKLGSGGALEADALQTDKLRFGWSDQSIEDINAGNWELINKQLKHLHSGKPSGVATTGTNALRMIAESTPEDIWIAFHQMKLWWTSVAGPVEQDEISKFRRTVNPWCSVDINGRQLLLNNISGKISQLQGFRGTACRVKPAATLNRLINGIRSRVAESIKDSMATLSSQLAAAIKDLHWKDFETLVDLVFRDAGWIRMSVGGQQAKAFDLDLEEAITGKRYLVQVKSQASIADLKTTMEEFSSDIYEKLFFIVHTPDSSLSYNNDSYRNAEVVDPKKLGEWALKAGLACWIENKVA
jgi:hypothetical protein